MNEQEVPQGSHGSDGVNEQQDLRPTDQHHSRIASVQLRLMLPLVYKTTILTKHLDICCCVYAAAPAPAVVGHSMQE